MTGRAGSNFRALTWRSWHSKSVCACAWRTTTSRSFRPSPETATMPEAAAVAQVSKHFNTGLRVDALVGVDLKGQESELVGLLGRSGAGKSTVRSLIGGAGRAGA